MRGDFRGGEGAGVKEQERAGDVDEATREHRFRRKNAERLQSGYKLGRSKWK